MVVRGSGATVVESEVHTLTPDTKCSVNLGRISSRLSKKLNPVFVTIS